MQSRHYWFFFEKVMLSSAALGEASFLTSSSVQCNCCISIVYDPLNEARIIVLCQLSGTDQELTGIITLSSCTFIRSLNDKHHHSQLVSDNNNISQWGSLHNIFWFCHDNFKSQRKHSLSERHQIWCMFIAANHNH